ncbi:hypothetical protein ACHAXA_006776 [Cyclostephanos tholiformis]|uniref:DUF1990 domain-containing protein n=1 Tax=Cyclostephanos tholiformis TaxID=382380 RepID=A0ABD3SS51_9STRA
MMLLSWIFHRLYATAVIATAVDTVRGTNEDCGCQTRFTSTRPTNENALSILSGLDKKVHPRMSGPYKISFNHGDLIADLLDEVGITRPTTGADPFPSCRGYTNKTMPDSSLVRESRLEGSFYDDDATIICSSTTIDGWRVLRYRKRVGFGRRCYRRVQHAMLDWDFEACDGNRCMGIFSTAKSNRAAGLRFLTRRHLLATFTGISFPKPLKPLFVINPVHVVYEVKNSRRLVPTSLCSSTAYATLTGHLLAGEERVTVLLDAGDAVSVEILSFSRPTTTLKGKFIWPLIRGMQRRFFLAEIHHLEKIAQSET